MYKDEMIHKEKVSVEIKITDDCNQCCFHCVNSDGQKDKTDHRICRSFIHRLKEWNENNALSNRCISEVRMTGGEPLLNMQCVSDITETCRTIGIKTGINTNGLLLNDTVLHLLKDAGLQIVKISFDSLDESKLMKIRGTKISLSEHLQRIQQTVKYGFKVILRLTLTTLNETELISCYEKACNMGVDQFQVKPLIPSGRALKTNAFLSSEQIRTSLKRLSEYADGRELIPQILCCPAEFTFGLKAKICGSSDKVYISTNGDVTMCNYMNGVPPVGNLSTDGIDRILLKRFASEQYSCYSKLIPPDCPAELYLK